METKHGFTKLTLQEFKPWLQDQRVARTILNVQQHHTWSPNYSHFNGSNHFERQQAMKNHHVGNNGWADIGQHFTIFPDGAVLTGRPLERAPACIFGHNANGICIENLGNFDVEGDTMREEQREAIIQVTAALCTKFNLPVNPFSIIYHHWFDLSDGTRNNGSRNNKSCPGTNFFGGNKVNDCITHFLPFIEKEMGETVQIDQGTSKLLKNAVVTANRLNVRSGPTIEAPLASDREQIIMGAILRVYADQDGWYKISNSQDHWVSGRYTKDAHRATVNADVLNVRSGPSISFSVVGSFTKGEEIFVMDEKDGWCKVGLDDQWVSKSFLTFAD